jgi:bacterial/archaeal transporter family protein
MRQLYGTMKQCATEDKTIRIRITCLDILGLPNFHGTMWWLYALLSAFFAALVAVFAKIGIKGVDSDLATAIRTVIILLIAWSIALAKGATHQLGGLTKQNWLFLILSGCATGLSWLFYFRALQLGEVSKVAPIDKLSVALAIVISVVFLHEKLSWQELAGAALIIGGTLLLIFK